MEKPFKTNANFTIDDEYSNIIEIENDNVVMFDCDDTLVENVPEDYQGETIEIENNGYKKKFKPLWKNIDSIKLHKTQGYVVGIWSHSGHEWSEAVIKALGLAGSVDIIMCKPKWYYDNSDANSWMIRIDNNKKDLEKKY